MTTRQREADAADAKEIQERLRWFIDRHIGTRYQLERLTRLSHSVVTRWFSNKHPSIPDTRSLIAIARKTHMSLDWLLLGEGAELRGAAVRSDEFEGMLRKNLVADLRVTLEANMQANGVPARQVGEFIDGASQRSLAGLLPDGKALYRSVRRDWINRVQDFLQLHLWGAKRSRIGAWVQKEQDRAFMDSERAHWDARLHGTMARLRKKRRLEHPRPGNRSASKARSR